MSKVPSMCGSLIRPFQPMVVRGFSKYTRITMNSCLASSSRSVASRRAYSSAAASSWIEQGAHHHQQPLVLALQDVTHDGAPRDYRGVGGLGHGETTPKRVPGKRAVLYREH